ncbi:unnamed protein product [Macrosiphum euphorbiae]|uniref:Uncharacterized protein n=1 Tax=Macrosiphum euphorbiae TaxID=13131 RepID=A0AAV0VWJ9_9HEMI|nr:unnamed protein product [Macrosiphum euphorbiae]
MTSTNLYAHPREHFLTKIVLDDLQPPEYLVRLKRSADRRKRHALYVNGKFSRTKVGGTPRHESTTNPGLGIFLGIQKTVKKKKCIYKRTSHVTILF